MPSYFFFQLKQVAGLIPAYLRGLIGVGGVGEGPGAPGAGPTGLGEPSPPGIGQDGAVGTRGTCCFAMSARTRSPCGERISGRPSRRSSLRTHRWSGRTPLRSRKARRTCPLHLGWRSPAPRGRGASTYRRGPPSRSHRLRRHRRRPVPWLGLDPHRGRQDLSRLPRRRARSALHARFAAIRSIAGEREIYAAGGVRDAADLLALKAAGAAGALISTALHERRIVAAICRGCEAGATLQLDLLAVGTELLEVSDHIRDVVV